MKEYKIEYDKVDTDRLKADYMDESSYMVAHQGLVIPCHDVLVQYGSGILLVKRLVDPAKGMFFSFGGRFKRGISIEESLKERVMDEAGLKLEDLTELGHARTYWETDPFGHGKGTDTFNIMYFARGKGKLRINNMHEEPMIVKPSDYPLIREQLHPYIQDFMDIAINLVK